MGKVQSPRSSRHTTATSAAPSSSRRTTMPPAAWMTSVVSRCRCERRRSLRSRLQVTVGRIGGRLVTCRDADRARSTASCARRHRDRGGVGAGIANGIAGGGSLPLVPGPPRARRCPPSPRTSRRRSGCCRATSAGVAGFRARARAARARCSSRSSRRASSAPSSAPRCCSAARPREFRAVVPWLIGVATVVFALQPLVAARRRPRPPRPPDAPRALLQVGTFAIADLRRLLRRGPRHHAARGHGPRARPTTSARSRGCASVLSILINAVAAVVFVVRGHLAGTSSCASGSARASAASLGTAAS